jgi:hypothetical protein
MSKNKIGGISVIAILLITLFSGCNKTNQAPYKNILTVKDELIMAIGSEPDTGFDPTTGWGRYGSPLLRRLKEKISGNRYEKANDYTCECLKLFWQVLIPSKSKKEINLLIEKYGDSLKPFFLLP